MSHSERGKDVARGCAHVFRDVLRVRAREEVLILVDDPMLSIGRAFYEAARETDCAPVWMVIPTPGPLSKEPPAIAAQALRETDVFIIPTSKGMTHTRARREACAAGARGLTLPGITKTMLTRGGVFADYAVVARAAERLARRLNGTKEVRVVSDVGTDLIFDVHGGEWFAERGLCTERGEFSNLPGGEVSMAPVGAEGTLIIDGSLSTLGLLNSTLRFTVEGRRITAVEGEGAAKFWRYVEQFGPDAFNVAEIGIGMNPRAEMIGTILEDEKKLGTVHVGIGDNSNMGGKTIGRLVSVEVHLDGVMTANPRLYADGELVDPRRFFDA